MAQTMPKVQAQSNQQQGRQLECKAVGTVSTQDEAALNELLQGMAGLPGLPILQHTLVLKGISRERVVPELRLLHLLASTTNGSQQQSNQDRWMIRHEGLPLRGRGVAELSASVRAVSLVQCSGQDVRSFWEALGFQLDHEVLQDGLRYVVKQEGNWLQILVAKVYRLEVRHDLASKVEVAPGHSYVEVTAPAAEGEHVATCHAIGSFAEECGALCELRKP